MYQKNFTFQSALPQGEAQDSFIDLDRLMAIVTRRIRTIIFAMAAFVILAVAYLLIATPSYTSMTQILLDESMTKYAEDQPPAASSQQADMEIASAVEILKSNEMALRVVDTADLANNNTLLNPPQSPAALLKSGVGLIVGIFTPGRPPMMPEEMREAQRQKVAAVLQDGLKVERVTRSSVVAVSFNSTDKLLAAKVTRAYADAYLTDQLNANFDATERASV